jgi:polyhydroxyalkanoate synthesis repressor PhaR
VPELKGVMHKLKKYPNRRLYDMTDSRYVTMEDARDLIVKGESIEVLDAKDGANITRSVLLQILAEQETEGHQAVLTNRAIEQIIRFYGDRMGGVVSRYIEQSIVSFLDHQEQFRSNLRQLNEMNPLNLVRQAFEAPFRSRTNKGKDQAPPPDPVVGEEEPDHDPRDEKRE